MTLHIDISNGIQESQQQSLWVQSGSQGTKGQKVREREGSQLVCKVLGLNFFGVINFVCSKGYVSDLIFIN